MIEHTRMYIENKVTREFNMWSVSSCAIDGPYRSADPAPGPIASHLPTKCPAKSKNTFMINFQNQIYVLAKQIYTILGVRNYIEYIRPEEVV